MGITIGRGAFDRRSVSTVARGLAVYAVVVGVHLLLGSHDAVHGGVRVLIDALLYIGLAIAIGALRPREMLSTVREAMRKPAQS
jgi:hypothetical protein